MRFSRRPATVVLPIVVILGCCVGAFARSPGSTVSRIRTGDVYRVTVVEELSGSLDLPAAAGSAARKLSIVGKALLQYRERPFAADSQGRVVRALRLYDRIEYSRRVGNQDQDAQLRPQVRRVVVDAGNRMGTYSPDGPMLAEEVEFVRTHTLAFVLEGFVEPNLTSGKKWNANPAAIAELTGLGHMETGALECVFEGEVKEGSRPAARIAFAGSVVGTSAEGRSRNDVRGTLLIDSATGRMFEFRAAGTKVMLDANERPLGKVQVDYRLVVEPIASDPELTDAVVAALPTPDVRLTSYLFDHPGLGVRLLYPRRWRLASVRERELLLQSAGNSLVIHVEAAGSTPATANFARDVTAHLAKQKLDVRLTVPVREASSPHGRIGHFRFEGTVDGQTTVLDYWVVARGSYGATLAARLAPLDAAKTSDEIEAIARSLAFSAPLPEKKP